MASRKPRQVPFYGWVCEDCLEVTPWNTDLLTTECSSPQAHLTGELVCVAISDDLKLEPIKPIRSLPKRLPLGKKKFSLCKNAGRSCQYEDNCMFAHSEAELKAWNIKLAESEGDSKSEKISDDRMRGPIRPLPKTLPSGMFILCNNADGWSCHHGDDCTYAHSKAELKAWNFQLVESEDDSESETVSDDWTREPIRSLPKRIPPGKKFSLCKNAGRSCQYEDNCMFAHSEAELKAWNIKLVESEDDNKSEKIGDDWILQPIRPLPKRLPLGKKFSLCNNGWSCHFRKNCMFPHSKAELKAWNIELAESEVDSKSETISDDRMRGLIRPLPKTLPSGMFILCNNADGSCHRGNDCTYAHNKAELKAWNAQLVESEDDSKSETIGDDWTREPIRPLPKRLPPGKKFSLCNNADGSCHFGVDCRYAHNKAELKAWNIELAESEDDSKSETVGDDWTREPIRPLPKRLPPGKKFSLCNNADRSCHFGVDCRYAHNKAELKAWNIELAESEDDTISDDRTREPIRPLPKTLPSGMFILCNNADGSCHRGNDCTYAHNKAELKAWNAQLVESEDDSKSETIGDDWTREPIRPLPKRLPPGKKFSLCNNADASCHFGVDCRYAHNKAELKAWNIELAESEDDSKSETIGDDWTREPIRPLPKRLPPGKKFSLCNNADGSCHFGVDCRYAHNKAELKAWNIELAESEDDTISDDRTREPIRPLPKTLPSGMFILCNNVDRLCHQGNDCTYAHNKAELKAWNAQLVGSEDYSKSESTTTVATGSLHGQVMQPKRQASLFRHQISSQPLLTPLPAQGRGYRSQSQSHSESSTHSASDDYQELRLSTITAPKVAHSGSQPQMSPSLPPIMSSLIHPYSPSSGGVPDVIHAPLSTDNYKNKFTELLKLEEIEHQRVLEEKCNGEYELFLYQYGTKPPAPPDVQYRRYGYLKDISGDQVAYATQASQGSIYILNLNQVNICKADILRDNYSHTEEKLYIGFEAQEEQKIQREMGNVDHMQMRVVVKFMLKHSYFRNLKSCVAKAAVHIIQKIVPTPRTFSQEPIDIRIDLKPFESLCSPDQLDALESILTCSPRGPPNIIVGPFGTGKTRLLAMAASCFFTEARIKQQHARILVCTQQRESVDNFYDHYQNLTAIKEEDDVEVVILRDHGFKHFNPTFRGMQQLYLVMSTCMMVHELKDIGDGLFTHILIDEGAQMREPEAIAPLSLAHPDTTKIVIAGDQHQVGPAMLVFGEVPSCGLATSLLERLNFSYKRLRQESYISTLVTNYRSHPDIFELPSSLFYDTPLISPSDSDPPSLHPLYPYPLVFVCSSINDHIVTQDNNVNEAEASILLDEVNQFTIAKNWPIASWGAQDMSQTCIMSPSRPQLTMINNLIRKKTLSGKLKTIRRLPTYDIQGREFRALFLSTSEQTNSDASSRHPTNSLCHPHIFNTAVTRAQSLVVAIGNPFLLLKTEKTMIEKYGKKGEVWSNYLKRCLEHGTFIFPSSLNLTKKKKKAIQLLLEDALDDDEASLDGTSNESTSMTDEGDFPLQPLPPQDYLLHRSLTSMTVQSVSGTSAMAASSSRWNEYEKKDQIGKGGFGVVFHVKHKVDQGDYALKIIKLSDIPKKQDKVLKEVTTLAKLEHPNIVRYYNSWKERAPDGWTEEELWSMLKSSDSLSTALIPVTTTMGSMSTTSSSTHTTNTPTDTHVVSSADFSQGAFGLTCRTADSVVSFCNDADSLPIHSQAAQPLLTESIDFNVECPKIQPSLPLNPPTCLFIQTELCKEDTLRTWLYKNCEEKSRTRSQVLSFFKQILEALVYIHQKSIVHRDLKPSNIFFSRGEEDRLKIGDFGLARTVAMPPGGVDTTKHDSADSYSKGSMQAGTFLYMSPEQVKGEKYDEKSDMFALGIILFELHYFMEARNQVLSALRKLEFPPQFEENHLNVTRIVKLLLAENPTERPTADKLLSTNSSLRKLSKKVRKKAKDDYILKF